MVVESQGRRGHKVAVEETLSPSVTSDRAEQGGSLLVQPHSEEFKGTRY